MTKKISTLILVASIAMFAAACPKKSQTPKSAAQLYNEGLSYMSRSARFGFANPPDFEKARERFEQVVYDYPTSRWAPLAELRIADAYYEMGDYELSAASYDSWRKNHVGRPELPYVTYRLAMSYYHQILTIDRDQTLTRQALYEFRRLVETYPDSEYAGVVGDKSEILRTRLAKHEFYVGKFYFRHRDYWAAADRFEGILDNFPKRGLDEAALYWSWRSYVELRRTDLAGTTYEELQKRFPEGSLAARARVAGFAKKKKD